jgi:hypothetical protein
MRDRNFELEDIQKRLFKRCDFFGAVATGTITSGIVAANIAGLGIIMSTYGMIQQQSAAKANAKFQADTARNRATLADRNAKEIEVQGKKDANKYRARAQLERANELVSMVAQGGDITSGSNIDLLADYAGASEEDALTIEDNANRSAYNTRVSGMNETNQANLFSSQANNINPGLSGATTAVSGISSVASSWAFRSGGGGGGGNKGLYQTSTANFNYKS